MKKLILPTLLCLVLSTGTSVFNDNSTQNSLASNTVKRSYVNHPTISGFTYEGGAHHSYLAADVGIGYTYYDMDIYYSPFTSVSRLYLIHTIAEFTSGSIATDIGEFGYDRTAQQTGGLVSIELKSKSNSNTGAHTSSYEPVAAFPMSTETTVTINSSYSENLTLNAEVSAGISLTDFSIGGKVGEGLTLSYSTGQSTTSPDPLVSYQKSPSNRCKSSWLFKFASVAPTTYVHEAFYFFEVKNDGNQYSDYSFAFDVSLRLDAVKEDSRGNLVKDSNTRVIHEQFGTN